MDLRRARGELEVGKGRARVLPIRDPSRGLRDLDLTRQAEQDRAHPMAANRFEAFVSVSRGQLWFAGILQVVGLHAIWFAKQSG